MDASGERGGCRESGCRVRAPRDGRLGRRRARPRGGRLHEARAGRGARRAPLHGAVRHARARRGGRAPRHPVGRRRPRDGDGHRPHRPGLRRRGLRSLARARPAGAHAGRRVGALLPRVRLAARALDGRGGGPDRLRPRRSRAARARGDLRSLVPLLLALSHAAHLPHLGRLVHRGRRASAAAPGRQRGGRVDARVHGEAHGRLAPQSRRLEHLAPPLLRPPPAHLPVRLRAPQRRRLTCRARSACHGRARAARGAAPAVDRRGSHPL